MPTSLRSTVVSGMLLLLCMCASAVSQRVDAVTGISDTTDVIDHRQFDSLWRASKRFGRLSTQGVTSETFRKYRAALSTATPSAFLPPARLAFWVNAYLSCLMEVMHQRVGYRMTIWDSLYLHRDTFEVAGRMHTLFTLQKQILAEGKTVQLRSVFATGSSNDPPFPAHAWTAKTAKTELRAQMRTLFRSEKYALYDPAGNVLQLVELFQHWRSDMEREAGGIVDFVIPWVSEAVAAQLALGRPTLNVIFRDRMETWKRRRP